MPESTIEVVPPSSPATSHPRQEAIRTRHYSPRTEEAYITGSGATSSSTSPAPGRNGRARTQRVSVAPCGQEHVSASTQTQALSALVFLYRARPDAGGRPARGVVRAKRPTACPSY